MNKRIGILRAVRELLARSYGNYSLRLFSLSMYRRPGFLCLILLLTAATARAQLPQAHEYQITLRNYIGTLTEADFQIALQPLTYSDGYVNSVEDVHRLWLWHENRALGITAHNGLRLPALSFTLNAIEDGGRVNMWVDKGAFLDPSATAWWAQWTYPGNPHRPGTANSLAAKRRAFVVAAVDLMMLDDFNEHGGGVRSDYMGGSLIWQAYTYYVVKDILPANVQAAYETGLRNMFQRIESVYPGGPGGCDMETFQLVGMWYAAEGINDDDLRARALNRAHYVLNTIIKPAGYEHHGGAFDSTYIGVALRFMTWASLLYRDSQISTTLEGMLRLKSHLTLPEPGPTEFEATFVGPSHFNTANAASCPEDQWCTYYRDVGDAMLSDEAKYLVYGGRYYPSFIKPLGVKNEATMKSDIVSWLTTVNSGLTQALSNTSATWTEHHWTQGLNYTYMYYQPGFYDLITSLQNQYSSLTKPLFNRKGNFIDTFADDFMVFKIGEYGAIIHSDVIRDTWANGIAGLSGGCLSAFWTPGAGTVILGLNGGSQSANYEQWSFWDTWACQAISGVDEAGRPFSSARNRQPNAVYEVSGNTSAVVEITGSIGQQDGGMSAPDNAITGVVNYARTFRCAPDGMRVRSGLTSDRTDEATELWEVLPLHLRQKSYPTNDAIIEFESGGSWLSPTTNLQSGVTRVRTTRFGESVYIVFDQPRSVKLSSVVNDRANSRIRNIMIDLLGSGGAPTSLPASVFVEYQIIPPLTPLTITGDPADFGSPAQLGYGRHTNLCYDAWITNSVGSPADETNGIRRVCVGWDLTYGSVTNTGISTQAVFYLQTNSTLTWSWANEYRLDASAAPYGGVTEVSGWYTNGTQVVLSATGSENHPFIDWLGDVPPDSHTNNPLTVTMDRPRTIQARFGYRLTVTGQPTSHGTSLPFGYGIQSNLAVNAWITNSIGSPADEANGTRYVCTGWQLAWSDGSPADNGAGTQAVVNVTGDLILRWNWTNQYQMSVSSGSGGSVSDTGGWYANLAVVTNSATPSDGYSFLQWSGLGVPDGRQGSNPLVVVMDQPRVIQANFASAPTNRMWSGNGSWFSPANWSPPGLPGTADVVLIRSGTIVLTDPVTVASVVVSSNATLVFSNWNTCLSAAQVTIQSNGFVTLPPAFSNSGMSNRVWIACSNMLIAAGGCITVDGKGYAGGSGVPNTDNGNGQGGGIIGANGSGAGSYGGIGGSGYNGEGGAAYGASNAPVAPGSGGGGGAYDGGAGGHGGGAVLIQATGMVTINGTITANGNDNGWRAGAGSGGGIWIACQVFAGINGAILANGGQDKGYLGGGGGGGRIAVTYTPAAQIDAPKPQVLFSVAGGSSTYGNGTFGSIYFPDNSLLNPAWLPHTGLIYIPGFNSWAVDTFTMTNGWLRFAADAFQLTVTNDVMVMGPNAILDMPVGALIRCGGSLTLTNGAKLYLHAAATNNAPDYGTLVYAMGDMFIGNNCWVYPYSDTTNGGSVFFRVRRMTVASGGGIDADFKGFSGGYGGNGRGPGQGYAASADGSGAGYGGAGGRSAHMSLGGSPYGSSNAPIDAGSGGGARTGYATSTGGNGGGAIRVQASQTVTVDGTLSANGGSGEHAGGSGGGIFVQCSAFAGSTGGLLTANGGNGGSINNGAGGGGRIAVWRSAGGHSYQGSYTAQGGTNGYAPGATGTIVIVDADPGWLSDTVAPVASMYSPSPDTVSLGPIPVIVFFSKWVMGFEAADIAVANAAITNFAALDGASYRFDLIPSGLGTVTADIATNTATDTAGNGSTAAHFTRLVAQGRAWKGKYGDWFAPDNWDPPGLPQPGENVTITNADANVRLTNSTPALAGLTLGKTLVVSGWDTAVTATKVNIRDNGIMTLAPAFTNNAPSNRIHIVCADLTVEASGLIDVDGRGYAGGPGVPNTDIGNGPGGGISGGNGSGGASYGGVGGAGWNGAGGAAYGASNAPVAPGSGGGGGAVDGGAGGHGGGAVLIQATGTVTINGTITANGNDNGWRAGAGSGGGIWIACHVFAGINGAILANGGQDKGYLGGGGGGGRIAVTYTPAAQIDAPKPQVLFSVAGGSSTYGSGTFGSLYFPDNRLLNPVWLPHIGMIYIPGFNSWAVDAFTMTNGWMTFPGSPNLQLTVTNTMTVMGSGSRLQLLDGAIACGNLIVTNGASLYLGSYSVTNPQAITCSSNIVISNNAMLGIYAANTNAVQTNYGAVVNVAGDILIGNGSQLIPFSAYTNGASPILRMHNLSIDAGGQINADAAGYGGSYGPGKGGDNGNYWSAGGGGYGGVGGSGAGGGGTTYGSSNAPVDPGSCGGWCAYGYGGYGGGLVRVEARGNVTVNGTISANGGAPSTAMGGGSGGGIYIRCRRFEGAASGVVRANGGTGGGSGGGGRIAVWRISDGFAGTVSATNGLNGSYGIGSPGTIVWGQLPEPSTIFIMR